MAPQPGSIGIGCVFAPLADGGSKAAPCGIGGLRPLGQGLDEVFELNLEGRAGKVLRRKLKRGHREVDALVVATPGAGQNFAHLTRVAAGDIDKREGRRNSTERVVVTGSSMRLILGYPLSSA